MNIHKILVTAASLSVLGLGSCTAKYQDMIRDRDETIRDLEGKLSTTRGENQRIKRELSQRESDLAAARSQSKVVPASVSSEDANLSSLKNALRDKGLREDEVNARYRDGRISLGIANQVTFASGSTDLSKSGRSVLDRVAQVLNSRYADKKIWVEGHTDTDPIRKSKDKFRSNRHLSSERADSVATYLVKRGLPATRVAIVGHGANDPINPSRKAENRRVEIVVRD